jgi:hypothetical protein
MLEIDDAQAEAMSSRERMNVADKLAKRPMREAMEREALPGVSKQSK